MKSMLAIMIAGVCLLTLFSGCAAQTGNGQPPFTEGTQAENSRDEESVSIEHRDIPTKRPSIAGNVHRSKPITHFTGRNGVLLVRFLAQQLHDFQKLNFPAIVVGHYDSPYVTNHTYSDNVYHNNFHKQSASSHYFVPSS